MNAVSAATAAGVGKGSVRRVDGQRDALGAAIRESAVATSVAGLRPLTGHAGAVRGSGATASARAAGLAHCRDRGTATVMSASPGRPE